MVSSSLSALKKEVWAAQITFAALVDCYAAGCIEFSLSTMAADGSDEDAATFSIAAFSAEGKEFYAADNLNSLVSVEF